MDRIDVAVVGGGQAGLSVSHELSKAGVEHVVLERGRVGQSWRDRWDSFCLVTPNWTIQLPGHPYAGDDSDGYLPRDEIVAYLEGYAAASDAPVREGVEVVEVASRPGGGFVLGTSEGDLSVGSVVLSNGAYQRPHRPDGVATLPAELPRLGLEDYRSPAGLPSGAVLVVGSGQSGCQIAEELVEAGREVVVACGRAPWAPRRLGGRDFVWWASETGFLDQPVEALPDPSVRLAANVQGTGRPPSHSLNYRTLRDRGVTLAGHLLGATNGSARFGQDLGQSVAWGDARYAELSDLIRKLVAHRGIEPPEIPEPEPFDDRAPERVDLAGFGAVVVTAGFRPDYSWTPWPDAFDDLGFPLHVDGASTVVPDLYFVGVHFLRKRKSSLFIGVGEDAAIVARSIAERLGAGTPVAGPTPTTD